MGVFKGSVIDLGNVGIQGVASLLQEAAAALKQGWEAAIEQAMTLALNLAALAIVADLMPEILDDETKKAQHEGCRELGANELYQVIPVAGPCQRPIRMRDIQACYSLINSRRELGVCAARLSLAQAEARTRRLPPFQPNRKIGRSLKSLRAKRIRPLCGLLQEACQQPFAEVDPAGKAQACLLARSFLRPAFRCDAGLCPS